MEKKSTKFPIPKIRVRSNVKSGPNTVAPMIIDLVSPTDFNITRRSSNHRSSPVISEPSCCS